MAMPDQQLTKDEKIQQIIRRNDAAKLVRAQYWEVLWDQVVQFLFPQYGSMIYGAQYLPGEKRGHRAYDNTPESALDILVAGLQSGTIPENFEWFDWALVPKWLNQLPEVRTWCQKCRDIAMEFIQASNYSAATANTYRHLGVFGTACKFREEDPDKALRFKTLRLTDCVFFEDARGIVDTLFREFKLSARNAVREWGDKAPDVCRTAVSSGNHEQEFPFLHAVFPRDDFDPGKRDRKNMRWASWWIYPTTKTLLDEGGFEMFPASVPRWDKMDDASYAAGVALGGSVYGRGPGIKILQDMGLLNQQARSNLIAGHKMVEPALAIPDDGFEQTVDLSPNAQNRWNSGKAKVGIQPIVTVANLPFAIETQDRTANAIKRAFHVDTFLAVSEHPSKTATEVLELRQEKLVILEPMVSRQKTEHLDLDLDWIFHVLDRQGVFPPPPDAVLQFGSRINTEYESPLFMAQRAIKAQKVISVFQSAGMIAQTTGKPDVLDNLDSDAAISIIVESGGAPEEILVDPEARDKMRAARVEQMKQEIALKEGQAAADAAHKLGKVPTDERNVTADALKQMGGQNPEEKTNAGG